MAISSPLDLEITIISAKHLKNVNWRKGPLVPYAYIFLDPAHRQHVTRPDDSLSSRPVWNETFTLPLTRPAQESTLTVRIIHHSYDFHPTKSLVGTALFPLSRLGSNYGESVLFKLDLLRPSGRPQGKVLVKLALKERPRLPDYQNSPAYHSYYYSAPPPPYQGRDYRESSSSLCSYADRCGHYSTYYPPPPLYYSPAAPSPSFGLPSVPSAPPPATSESVPGGSGAPSAPVDYSLPPAAYARTGGGLAGAMRGLSLDEERIPGHEASVPKADYRDLRRWY